jgi:hypothetical protein
MKTSVIKRKYTVKLGLLLIAMFVDYIFMYQKSEGGVSHANRNCNSDFATMRSQIFMLKNSFWLSDTKFINEMSLFLFL